MAEALISMLVQQLASVTYKYMEGEVTLVLDGKKEVEIFSNNLKAIQAVLDDAEKRQVTDAGVKDWLDNLKDVSYEMDNILDEWNTDILKQKAENQEREAENSLVATNKVCLPIPSHCFCFRPVGRAIVRRNIAQKIKQLNERLTQISNTRQMFHFQNTKSGGDEQLEHQKTTSFVDLSHMFGRKNEKDLLVSKLLNQSGQQKTGSLIIPIVGMGGMGKTALSQLVYNNKNVKTHFDIRIWVCVSDPFDVIKIAKAIITGAKDVSPNSDELEDVLQHMSRSIGGRKFLLVLDDVWTHDDRKWELIKFPLMQSGAEGSRILVTTRKQEVAIMMGATSHMMILEGLSEEICWSIFKKIAFHEREEDESSVLGSIGREIAKKCKGLPLAAKTLGGLMRYKKTREEWKDVLNSKIWDLKEVEEHVFKPLLLSYYDLDPAIKRCLLFTAIFPKDYAIEKNSLIEMWMSQDFLNSKGNKEKKITGQIFFDNLVMRSLFQDFVKDLRGNILECKMHDIVHDFVQFLTKNDCFCLETKGTDGETELSGGNETIESLNDKVRHLTLMFASKQEDASPFSVAFYKFKSLRTFAAFNSNITTIPSNVMLQLKCVRTLKLRECSIKEIPEEIGELVHLRYIDLSFNYLLEKLPNTVCNLYNLQTLGLEFCRGLKNLPRSMGKLINLKHLHNSGCYRVKYLPKGIGRLTGLRELDECPVFGSDDSKAFKLGDLRGMDQLQGRLIIRILGDVKDVGEAEKAQLGNKKQLSHLGLRIGFDSNVDIQTLNALRPHQDLESLDIRGHKGNSVPNWILSLHNLKSLTLVKCQCDSLPPLGKLPSLEELRIGGMSRVKKVGVEFLGIEENQASTKSPSFSSSSSSSCILFPKLKLLHLVVMAVLEEWEGVEGWKEEDCEEITIMPRLSSLAIFNCPELKTLPNFLRKTLLLQSLSIERCPSLARGCQKGRGKEWPKISHVPNIKIV